MQRITLISFLLGAAIVPSLFAANAGAAHGPASHPQKSVARHCTKQVTPSGTVKFSDWEFPDTLNPDQTTLQVSNEIIDGFMFGLFRFDNHAHLTPLLAATVPSTKNGGIANGGRTYTIHLKAGLKWSNGQSLTSKDIKFGWLVDMDKASGPYCTGSCDVISRIDTPNATTAVFHLEHPSAPFLSNDLPEILPVSWPNAWNGDPATAAKKMYQDTSFNFEGPNFPTDGAYQVYQFVHNDRIVMEPMKYYTATSCGAYVKNPLFVFYSSKDGMIAAAANHETDITQDYTAADLPELQRNKTYTIHVDPGFFLEHLEFNHDATYKGQPNPVANADVRLALALALDKYGLIQSALGVNLQTAKQIAAWSFLVNTPTLVQPFADKQITGQWDPITKKFTAATGSGQALDDAKKLLAATPWSKGFSLDFYTTSGNPVRQAQEAVIASSWAKIGVKVSPNYLPADTLFAGWDQNGPVDHGNFQVLMFAYFGSPDPDSFHANMQSQFCDRTQSVHSSINGNDACIHDSVIDHAYTQGAESLSKATRQRAYAAIQLEVNKLAYWIPLYFRPSIVTNDGQVVNFSNNPTLLGAEWNMYAWKAKQG